MIFIEVDSAEAESPPNAQIAMIFTLGATPIRLRCAAIAPVIPVPWVSGAVAPQPASNRFVTTPVRSG